MDPDSSVSQTSLPQALDQLWHKFLPQIQERIAILRKAARALAEGHLSPHLRAEACSAAHKLAGILGTFGLAEGTTLAREAESICSPKSELDPHTLRRFTAIADQLQATVLNRR